MSVVYTTNSLQTEKMMSSEKTESQKDTLMWVHILAIVAVLLSGIHYTCLQYYIKTNGSAFLFLIGRTVLTIPAIIGVLIQYKMRGKLDKKSQGGISNEEERSKEERTLKEQTSLQSNETSGFIDNRKYKKKEEGYVIPVECSNLELQKKTTNTESQLKDLEELSSLKKEEHSDTASRLREAQYDRKIPRVAFTPLIFLCICGALRHIIFIIALYFTPTHNIAIVQPTIPILIALFSSYLKIEKLNKYAYTCLMLTFIGLCITVRIWDIHSIDMGFFLLLLVPIAKALQVISISLASKYVDESLIHVFYLSGVFLLTLPFAIAGEVVLYRNYTIVEGLLRLNYKQMLCILYSTIGVLLIFWRIQIYILKHLSPVAVSLYNALQPFCTFLLANIFLKEVITINKYIGTSCICFSLLLYQYGVHNMGNSKISK